ncbi:hypothetical protein KC19_2G242300 [Ceratodon purpureus]|uniref:Uncharacterized protein n=1 Tax=Ceratodon purpureus TaxID=3225 RepID=A0A8T0IZM9_CERPU|nr:hypothetical protein KC19_2G242300 [Ceratodon purpureus]
MAREAQRGRHEFGIRGAMVARLTPDQKAACSIHVGFNPPSRQSERRFDLFRSNVRMDEFDRVRSKRLWVSARGTSAWLRQFGRVVKAADSKSAGVFPRRFKFCG